MLAAHETRLVLKLAVVSIIRGGGRLLLAVRRLHVAGHSVLAASHEAGNSGPPRSVAYGIHNLPISLCNPFKHISQ